MITPRVRSDGEWYSCYTLQCYASVSIITRNCAASDELRGASHDAVSHRALDVKYPNPPTSILCFVLHFECMRFLPMQCAHICIAPHHRTKVYLDLCALHI